MTLSTSQDLADRLKALGFQRKGTEFRRRDLRVRIESRWVTFLTSPKSKHARLHDSSRLPGLWKQACRQGVVHARVFDLPMAAVSLPEVWDDSGAEPIDPIGPLTEWAATTMDGTVPADWQHDGIEVLQQSVPGSALTMQIGPFARQAQLSCSDQRVAVTIPLLPRIPFDLSPGRSQWIERLLADVQDHSRMVRIVETELGENMRGLLVEADLTGAPSFAMPLLVRCALDALRHVVSQSISIVELLVDPTVTSTGWGIPLAQESPAKGGQS